MMHDFIKNVIPSEMNNMRIELDKRIDELSKDSSLLYNMARTWLVTQGYNVKYLSGGLLGLMDYLKGGKAKALKV